MIIKTDCKSCGKKKAIKHLVEFIPGDCIITTIKGCYKCGWKPEEKYKNVGESGSGG